VLKPATLLRFHRHLVKRNYRALFTAKRRGKPGPKGPSQEVIHAIVEMKRRNPRFGYQRIADQINLTFGLSIDKSIVRSSLPAYLSSDNDPLSEFQRWKANLRVLDITEVKTVPYTPVSHPFVERLIGTIRRE
jgi:hypothetical protein